MSKSGRLPPLHALALFLLVAGARLALIRHYARAVPFWDQWEAEGANLLKPWLAGAWGLRDLFAPHNEHRIVLTRLLALTLFRLNGQWDPALEMACNAVGCAVGAVALAWALTRAFGGEHRRTILAAVTLGACLPFGWENTLCGFQSQNYFLIGFSLAAVAGLGVGRPGTAAWWLGLAGATLACLSMGSGFLAAAAALGIRAWRLARERRRPTRGETVTALLCLGLVAAGWLTRTAVPGHEVLRAGSPGAWLEALGRFLAWPLGTRPVWAWVAVAPLALLAAAYARVPGPARRRDELLLGFGGWWLLQAAALAWARGGNGALPASRYLDLLAVGTLAGGGAWLALGSRAWRGGGWGRWLVRLGAAGWAWLALLGLWRTVADDFRVFLPARFDELRRGESNVHGYVATHDLAFLQKPAPHDVPFPDPNRLAALLDDPALRAVLPVALRPALELEPVDDLPPGAVADSVGAGGDFLPGTPFWRFAPAPPLPATVRLRTTTPRTLPYVRFVLKTNPGAAGRRFVVGSPDEPGQPWLFKHGNDLKARSMDFRVPGTGLAARATVDALGSWLVFTAPTELGAWSHGAAALIRQGEAMSIAGLLIAAGLGVAACLRRAPVPVPGADGPLPDPGARTLALLSVVIPARDEEGCIGPMVRALHERLCADGVPHEIVVVDDGSTDGTWTTLEQTRVDVPTLRAVQNPGPHGFGRAIIYGLDHMRGDAVVIMMADESDAPDDAVRYWRALGEGFDCVFGSRFVRGGCAEDYPRFKLAVNRLANTGVRWLFGVGFNDTTNAFKAYRREVIDGCRPLIAAHFNLTVELPLKAAVRGYRWTVVPITWRNRRAGAAKFRLKEMGSRYLFICLTLWLEKHLSRGDYHRPREQTAREE